VAPSVLNRVEKMGFPTLGRQWFAGPWHAGTADLIASRDFRESGVCDVAYVSRQLERHRRGEIDATRQLFRVVQFGIWFARLSSGADMFMEKEPSAPAARSSVRVS
jgi:hypothetical protein